MASSAFSQSRRRRGAEKYFGGSAPQRAVFLVLISILACMSDVVLAVTLWSAHPRYPISFIFYSFVAFHLMPWIVGLRNLRRVQRALQGKRIDVAGANLSYSIVLGMLVNTYVVLGAGETMAILAYRLGALHVL
jgi:hypothetical protein